MEKQTLQTFKEYSEDKFTKRIIFNKGDSTVFVLNFMLGQELPEHTHPSTEVYLLVLEGEGTFIIDGKETAVTANDVVHCGSEERLAFKNSGENPVSLYVMLNKIPNENYAKNI
ncbi:MAG TPA: cupin domain-containing protein [Bacillus bacterium]|nr:cupin domain-containing protein [Bacillus sp. (in: firmicutes)]